MVGSSGQMRDTAGCASDPLVSKLENYLPVNLQVVSVGHGAAGIQHDPVVTLGGYFEITDKLFSSARLPLGPRTGRHIYVLACSCRRLGENESIARRIQLCHPIVVPEDSISLTRQEEWKRYLGRSEERRVGKECRSR